jgi:Pirin
MRVINKDPVRSGAGFDTHGHQDMEIISYFLEGALEHNRQINEQHFQRLRVNKRLRERREQVLVPPSEGSNPSRSCFYGVTSGFENRRHNGGLGWRARVSGRLFGSQAPVSCSAFSNLRFSVPAS